MLGGFYLTQFGRTIEAILAHIIGHLRAAEHIK
jgi:hypothetical protein